MMERNLSCWSFFLDSENKRWEFRFGRTSRRQNWKPLPWSNSHRTSFWAATYIAEDGKQHLAAGLDEFPERRFFFAKMKLHPQIVGFGPPQENRRQEPFYIRDIAVFGRMSLLPMPFASRDHFVEIPAKNAVEARVAVEKCSEPARVLAYLQLPRGGGTLLVCRTSEDAKAMSESFEEGCVPLRSSQWQWPNHDETIPGIDAAKAHLEASRACWANLQTETTRELALFDEHLQRKTRHLEGTRIARGAASRMICGNLKGDAPLPRPPAAGV